MTNGQRKKLGRQAALLSRRMEDQFRGPVQRALKAKVDTVVRVLKTEGVQAAVAHISKDITNPRLGEVVKALYRIVGLRHATRQNDILRDQQRGAKGWITSLQLKRSGRLGYNQQWINFISDYLTKNLFEKVTINIDQTTRDAMLKAILKGVQEGKGVDDIVRTLGNDWPFLRYQAARIIRTEVNRAANVGAMAAGSTFEFEQNKEWIAAEDARTRGNPINGEKDHADHWHLNGMVTEEDGFFTDPRNGDLLRFPGDPNGSAASVVNCRCHVALVGKEDSQGRLIPKEKVRASRISVILPQNNRPRQVVTI